MHFACTSFYLACHFLFCFISLVYFDLFMSTMIGASSQSSSSLSPRQSHVITPSIDAARVDKDDKYIIVVFPNVGWFYYSYPLAIFETFIPCSTNYSTIERCPFLAAHCK